MLSIGEKNERYFIQGIYKKARMENITRTDKENPIKKIVIEYEDGTIRDVEKGFIADVGAICGTEDGEEVDIRFNFVNIGGKDIAEVIYSVTELGVQMGLFDK